MRKKTLIVIVAIFVFSLNSYSARAQSDTPKLEVGAQYTMLDLSHVSSQNTVLFFPSAGRQHGVGGRFVFNPTNYLSLETEVNVFPNGDYIRPFREATTTQALFGIKAGKRFDKIGVFGKVRPGLMHFGKDLECPGETFDSCTIHSKTEFVTDLGGVVEYYPARHVAFRVDVGDTIIRYGDFKFVNIGDDRFPLLPFKSGVTHNFQLSVGVSFRF
jgi:hypothetical protein